jgi:flagellar hook-length control protein FliK
MSISVNPLLPVVGAQGVAADLVLQPGSVVEAQVLKLLSDELVQIAIAGLSIDVVSEVSLSAGQNLQLAVSQTESGIRLAIVPPQAGAGTPTSPDTVTLAPDALAAAAGSPSIDATAAKTQLTPLERLAVTAAAQDAAAQQDSLAPLFANLEAVLPSNNLPPKLQQAVLDVLAQRTSLDQNLSGGAIKDAVQKSGLFLEASLASGAPLLAASVSPATGVPDLKAALLVLRQTILSSLGQAGTNDGPVAAGIVAPIAPSGIADASANQAVSAQAASQTQEVAALAPALTPDFEIREVLLPQARAVGPETAIQPNGIVRIVAEGLSHDAPHLIAAATALNLLQEQATLSGNAAAVFSADASTGRTPDNTLHPNTPPPPFRGALPSAQPVALPSLAPDTPLPTTAHHLLNETDAALARQTLLQVASVPDRVDAGARVDTSPVQWNLEIPFATPQGTAVAQFEISRDRAGHETEAVSRIWRARFSLDVEPAGPVHALVSLSGERTSVRIWAERASTAVKLRDGAAQLSQALSKADLVPGEIVIRDGAPPQPAPARAGHFLDRAL